MTQTELEKREAALAEAGYHKSRATSASNDYSWFKTVKDPNDPEGWLYMIEWRVWGWLKYADQEPYFVKQPYSMELCILVCMPDYAAARTVYPDTISIEDAERLAKDIYELITNTIDNDNTNSNSRYSC